MKTIKVLAIALIAGATMLTSCGGGGVSEELKKEMTTFEGEWKAATDAAEAFGKAVSEQDSLWKQMSAGMVIADSVKANATPEMLVSIDSIAAICNGHGAKFAELKTTYEGFKAGWDNDGKAWGEWKAKVEKGEVKEEDAKKEMANWNTKVADAKKNVEEWNAALDATKTECGATCEAHTAAVAAIPAEPVNEVKGKKTK